MTYCSCLGDQVDNPRVAANCATNLESGQKRAVAEAGENPEVISISLSSGENGEEEVKVQIGKEMYIFP